MTEADLIGSVVTSYHCIPEDGISSWACWSENLKVHKVHTNRICHSFMTSDPKGCDTVITAYPCEKAIDFVFFDFMKNVLYRKFTDHIHLDCTPRGEYYIRLSGCDILPANVVYSICITSRIPIEFRKNLDVWEKLCDQGLDQTVAFLCMGTTAKSNIDKVVNAIFGNVANTNHWPIDHGTDPQLVLDCDLHSLSVPFKNSPQACTPCNCIWGVQVPRWGDTEGARPPFKPLQGSTIRAFSALLGKELPANEDLLQSS